MKQCLSWFQPEECPYFNFETGECACDCRDCPEGFIEED